MLAKLLIIPIVLVIGFVGWTALSNRQTTSINTPYPSPTTVALSKTFTASSVMDNFTIQLPPGFKAEQKFATVTIKNNNKEILIAYTGSESSSLKEIFSQKTLGERKVEFTNINTLDAGVETTDARKVYYIYNDYSLFSLSTNYPELFPVLDQIAQSFTLPK